ncbi:MAG: P-type conjugative transfer protein TrbL, partial [Mesorhizobium sp.]
SEAIASAPVSSAAPGAQSPPACAARMKSGQTMSHGASMAAHSVRSGDHGGGSMNVSLNQDDRQ